jgi:alkylhydroperoxidase/carboxymuconolactone decarboxylase family protein YurZ
MPSPNFELFKAAMPGAAEQYAGLARHALAAGALDARSKELIYLTLLGVLGFLPGMRSHIEKLLAQGVGAEVIREAVLVALPAAGVAAFLNLLPEVEACVAEAKARGGNR